jgi:hypothetical protein
MRAEPHQLLGPRSPEAQSATAGGDDGRYVHSVWEQTY